MNLVNLFKIVLKSECACFCKFDEGLCREGMIKIRFIDDLQSFERHVKAFDYLQSVQSLIYILKEF